MNTMKLANYMEQLRYGRNMTQDEFISGVISNRQYQRYRCGECEMPLKVITKLAKKLRINEMKLIAEFETESLNESKLVHQYFNSVLAKNFVKAEETYRKLANKKFLDAEKQMFFESAKILNSYYEGRLAKEDLVTKQYRLINYPNVLSNSLINDAETFILGLIMEFSETDRDKVLRKLIDVDNLFVTHITGKNDSAKLQIIFWICKTYGRKNDYQKVIEYCLKGLAFSTETFTCYIREYFYYYTAVAYYYLNDNVNFKIWISRTIHYVFCLDEEERARFYKKIQKFTDVDPIEYLKLFE
mgnify:FL=1